MKKALPPFPCRGFTLIEMAVVMLLIVIILGMITLNLGNDDTATVRQEARRMALLLQTAQQEAILKGRVVAVVLDDRGYAFLELASSGKFQPLPEDDVLRSRVLAAGVVFDTVEIEGAAEEDKPRLLLFPTGELAPFTITFSHGKARWQVQGTFNGEIRSLPPPEPRNA